MIESCSPLCSKQTTCNISAILSAWPNIRQAIQALTEACSSLQQHFDDFWYQQTRQLQHYGAFTQSTQQQYVTQLATLHQSLPLVLELSLEASQSCSFALLDQLNFPEGIALSVQLLLWQHQPSPAVRQLLSRGIEQGTDDCVAVVVWTTALSALQVHDVCLH